MKKIAAGAINALKDALASIYWYKSGLRSFLLAVISDNNLLSKPTVKAYSSLYSPAFSRLYGQAKQPGFKAAPPQVCKIGAKRLEYA